MSKKTVQNAHMARLLPQLHRALIDIVTLMNRPEQDAALLRKAGLTLERALFPLLVLVERLGPIGVVDLASRVGRDHTTVSRQVARLEALGLVTRQASVQDRRVRQARITPAGKQATDALDAARERLALKLFESWDQNDFDGLVRLMRRLADGLGDGAWARAGRVADGE